MPVHPGWSGICSRTDCGKEVQGTTSGLFCANFSHAHPPFGACRSAWCEGCYRKHADDDFRVNIPLDDEGQPIRRGDDEHRFHYGRSGDHLMIMFQCDSCHVRNMLRREPRHPDLPEETLLNKCPRRAILDSLWCRERSTVGSNLRRGVALKRWAQGRVYRESSP